MPILLEYHGNITQEDNDFSGPTTLDVSEIGFTFLPLQGNLQRLQTEGG